MAFKPAPGQKYYIVPKHSTKKLVPGVANSNIGEHARLQTLANKKRPPALYFRQGRPRLPDKAAALLAALRMRAQRRPCKPHSQSSRAHNNSRYFEQLSFEREYTA